MSDLVKWLREASSRHNNYRCDEAADHIEEVNRAFEAYATETMERIDRLEAALLRMVEWAESHGLYADEEAQLHPVFTNARAVLEVDNE